MKWRDQLVSVSTKKAVTFDLAAVVTFPFTIFVEGNTDMTITDTLLGSSFIERAFVIVVERGGSVRWLLEHFFDADAQVKTDLLVTLKDSAQFSMKSVQVGGSVTNTKITLILDGQDSQAHIVGRVSSSGNGNHSYIVVQHHYAPDTTSSMELKAVVADASSLSYEGTITIEELGFRSTAHQEQKNLIVGSLAKVTSVPNLQVLTNDVKCGHGSAVSYVNEEHLFYLQSRGISLFEAEKMIIDGFLFIEA